MNQLLVDRSRHIILNARKITEKICIKTIPSPAPHPYPETEVWNSSRDIYLSILPSRVELFWYKSPAVYNVNSFQ